MCLFEDASGQLKGKKSDSTHFWKDNQLLEGLHGSYMPSEIITAMVMVHSVIILLFSRIVYFIYISNIIKCVFIWTRWTRKIDLSSPYDIWYISELITVIKTFHDKNTHERDIIYQFFQSKLYLIYQEVNFLLNQLLCYQNSML